MDPFADMHAIPSTKEEWESIKKELIESYRLEDKPETWTFVLSQIQGVTMPELQFSLPRIVAFYRRWKIAAVLQAEKAVYIQALEDKLRAELEARANEGTPSQEDGAGSVRDMPEGASDLPRGMQSMPEPSEGMVSNSQ